MKLKPLRIGDLEIKIPIIQGAMGIKVSTFSLASAVAVCGAAGTIASVGLGFGTSENNTNFRKASKEALRNEIRSAKRLTDGVVGVNNMVALDNYEDLVRISAEENVDFIASGAGLPLRLPEFTQGSSVKLIPIVSSPRAAAIIIKAWKKRYNRLPDAFIVEGPLAGGHLGFSSEDLESGRKSLESIVIEIIKVVNAYEIKHNADIPIIVAGGIFSGADIARFLKLGVCGVQIATRFVTTPECDVSEKFKKMYIAATEEDIVIIKSPVGMPGRALKTPFIETVLRGEKINVNCNYRCLKTCNPLTTPYCISKALYNAVLGKMEEGLVFAGHRVSQVKKIISVKALIEELVWEAEAALE
jgi:nitronate monooxygenase